ncbi:MAG: hypothetical protein PHU46_01590 [Rhodocyclaceae bacterium]|nr:hypothetical protein [Rhodocyclaceae bacterium]
MSAVAALPGPIQGQCATLRADAEQYARGLPNFQAQELQNVVASFRNGIQATLDFAPGNSSQRVLDGLQGNIDSNTRSRNDSVRTFLSLSSNGTPARSICNPNNADYGSATGSATAAYFATQIGKVFETWRQNVVGCELNRAYRTKTLPNLCELPE